MQASSTAIPAASDTTAIPAWSHRVARSRLAHFIVLGAAIFIVAPKADDPRRLVVTDRELAALHAAQAARAHVASLPRDVIARIDQRAIEDEIIYREALRLGIDKGDNTVRQHLIGKTLIFAEDLGGASRKPSEAELRAWFERTRERWLRGKKVHFIHVFAATHDAITALARRLDGTEQSPPAIGDSFPSSREVTSERSGVAGVFGDGFADHVFGQAQGGWGEPVESRFGWHLVKVLSIEDGRPMSFEEARAEVVGAWTLERRHQAVDAFLRRAYPRYELIVDGERRPLPAPSERLGLRLDPSAED